MQLVSNFAETTIEEYFDIGDTSLVVNSSDVADFPTPGSDYFVVTLYDGVQEPELVKVTAVAGDTWTVVRGWESSSTSAWAVGTGVRLGPTAGLFDELRAADDALDTRVTDLEAASPATVDTDFLFCHGILA